MFHHDPGSHSSHTRPPVAFPFHTPRRLTRRQVLLAALLCLVILSGVIGGWSTGLFTSHAAGPLKSAPASMTFQQFLNEGRHTPVSHGPSIRRSAVTPPPGKGANRFTDYATLPPSAEPATMQPLSAPLSSAFLAGSPGATALDLKGSDGRLDVQLQPGSLDLSHATVPGGGAPVGALSVNLTQIHGHYVSLTNVLGRYQLQLVDNLSHVISGITLRAPVTISYHYQLSEMAALGIDPGHVLLTWPTLIATALQAKTPTTGLTLPMRNDPLAHTLTAQSMVLAPTPFDSSSLPANQSLPALHLASVQGNAGQSSYSYPMPLPPGTGGFTPQLSLSYSSAAPNERHNRTSPAGDEGDGWSLNLGSISAEVYPTTPVTTWYVLNNVANVGDRLIPTANNLFDTEHISYLRIQQINPGTDTTCFHVWDKAGTYYELGCTADSLQYWTDSNGTRYDYRWDVNKIVAPSEGPHSAYYKLILASYLQESVTTSGQTSIRDAALKQIIYGDGLGTTSSVTDVAGTVDFLYHAPFTATSTSGDSTKPVTWAQAYSTNYNCSNPPVNTTWRCDDPLDNGSSAPAPTVMSTMTLDQVQSYVGSDASSQAYQYNFSYAYGTFQDTPFSVCYDPHTLAQEYCAGEHLLMSVTPWVFQSTGGKQLRAVTFGYSSPLHNTYYDSVHKTTDNSQQYSGQTYWQYLNFYEDLNTGVGGRLSYATAYNNAHGTPTNKDGNGTIIDDRYDPLFCTTNSTCTGNYAHPDDYAWSEQVVTSMTALGTDSSASALQPATTTYHYQLAKTGTYSGSGTWCSPDQYNVDKDCVGDNWLPSGDGDWLDYQHAEYQGFAQVWTTSPAQDLTVDYSYSTEGWNTPMSDYQNFLGSQLYRQEVYSGTSTPPSLPSTLLTRTETTYATLSNACRSTTVTYPACETVVLTTKATDYEGTTSPSAPWVQHDYTYDDYSVQYGLPGGGYHNLLQDSISSANASGLLKQWSYSPNDQTTGGWTYYTVDNATHSEVDDSTGHLWQCQDITYDEGAGTNIPTPAAGLPTTVKTYSSSACTPTRGSPLTTSYQGYDAYGNTVASVDGVAAANSALYTSSGCTLATAPVIKSSAWSKSHYTACSVYDSYNAQPATVTNALGQASSISYDYTQGALPTSATDPNSQVTSTSYSYDANGNRTIQVSLPLHSGSYTSQSSTASGCTNSSTLPCFELDSKTYLYNTVQSSTFYDSLGRAVETRTPGPRSGDDTLVITTYNDQAHTVWQSVPFEVSHGSGWVDPNGVTDYQGIAPGGTVTFFDALGRPLAAQDPLFGSSQEPGIACSATLGGNYTACSNYNLGSVSGDTNTYVTRTSVDPNKHVRVGYLDALGRTVYTQEDSGRYGGGPTVNQRQNLVYNVLNELTQVKVIDKAPLTNQTITTATTTAQYDDLGRLTQVADPDRGTHSYTLDADGRVLTDVSGTRTIGSNYDLLGRVGCVQDAAPTINATGACSAGNPYVQNTYDTNKLTVSGTTDYPIGRLTQSVAKTYLTGAPGGDSVTTTQSYEHDARGRLQAAQLQFGTLPNSWGVTTALPSYLAQYTLNDADQLYSTTTSTTPAGQGYSTSQIYDPTTGVLTGLSNQALATSANLATLVYNARAQVDTSNFQTTTGTALASDQFGYDANLRPTSVTATWQSGSGTSGTMLSQSRSYDPASNVISLSTTQAAVPGQSGSGGSESQNFCYDEQNRLVWAGNSGTQPGAGNGTCGTSTLSNTLSGASYNNSYVYTHLDQLWQGPLGGSGTQQQYLYCNSQPHELTGLYASGATCANQTGQVYTSSYDSWGNVTSRTYSGTTSTLTYDLLDHFVSWNAGAQNKDLYVYDASGTRVLRRTTTSSGTTMTVYAFGLEEHSYFNTGGHKGDLYYYTLGGRLLGALDNTGKTTFYLSDALGSVLASFSNAAGIAAIKGNQVFGPYGNARDSQGTINTAKGFTGQYNDSLTGLDYYGSRYYDQVAGVFLSADTVHGNGSGANPYAYVGGNPETYSDPTGQMFVPPGGGGSPGGVTGGGGSSSPSSMVQAVNAVLPTSTAAQGGSQPCLQIGCVSLLRAKVGFQATVNHFMSINLPTMVCDPFCFISIGEGQTIVTSTISGVTEAPFTHCGVSPFVCSDHGDTGVNGHDMPDVAAADTGGGAAGNPGGEPSDSAGELPQQADLMAKVLVYDAIPNALGRSRTTIGVAYIQDSEGSITRLVSMNSNSIQRWGSEVINNLSPADVWVPSQGAGLHAEQNLVRYAASNGLDVLGLGASRNICGMCWSELTQTLRPSVIGTPSTTGWIPPWMWLL